MVFEDVDRAPFEVLSALVPLLEGRKLYIPGFAEVLSHAAIQHAFVYILFDSKESMLIQLLCIYCLTVLYLYFRLLRQLRVSNF